MQYAGFGKRLLASIIDSFLIGILATLGTLIHPIVGTACSVLGGALYFILMEGGTWHATLGKRALHIVVTDINGEGASYGKATVRYLGKFISGLVLCIGYLMAAFTEKKQALHDMMASTLVLDGSAMEAGTMAGTERKYYSGGAQPAPGSTAAAGGVHGRYILGISGEFAGRSVQLTSDGTIIGRDPVACQIALSVNTQGVSRHHCQVNFNPQTGMFILNDLGSSYGTFLQNGTRISSGQPVALRPGERFFVGSQVNSFEVR